MMRIACLAASLQSVPVVAPEPDSPKIDAYVEARLDAAGASIAPLADDSEFLRRVTVDLAGVVPSAQDVREFLADAAPDKRGRLIDRLLASDACATRLARFLLDLTTGHRASYAWFANLYEYFEWLESRMRDGATFEAVTREILTARGQLDENGATNFIMFYKARADQLASATARVFLGASLGCAQCHDHPTRGYRREQFWGVAAFFARTRSYIVTNGDHGITDTRFGRVVLAPLERPEALPLPGEIDLSAPTVLARWIDGTPAASEDGLRGQLADFVVRDPRFARNLANRVWARLFGRGLVEPLDDMGDGGPHAELLDQLARFSGEHQHDLRALLRAIVSTRTYQRAGAPSEAADDGLLRGPLPRPLDVDQLHATFDRLLASAGATGELPGPSVPPQLPPTRATNSVFAPVMRMLSPDFDETRRIGDPVQLERIGRYYCDDFVPEMFGGDPGTVQHWLVRQNRLHRVCNTVSTLMLRRCGPELRRAHAEELWLELLSRLPHPDEIGWIDEWLGGAAPPRDKLADLAWALINSQEFSNNH